MNHRIFILFIFILICKGIAAQDEPNDNTLLKEPSARNHRIHDVSGDNLFYHIFINKKIITLKNIVKHRENNNNISADDYPYPVNVINFKINTHLANKRLLYFRHFTSLGFRSKYRYTGVITYSTVSDSRFLFRRNNFRSAHKLWYRYSYESVRENLRNNSFFSESDIGNRHVFNGIEMLGAMIKIDNLDNLYFDLGIGYSILNASNNDNSIPLSSPKPVLGFYLKF